MWVGRWAPQPPSSSSSSDPKRTHPQHILPTQAGLGRLLDGEVKPPTRKEEAWRFTDLSRLYGKRHVAPPHVRWSVGLGGIWWCDGIVKT